jgi:hypothetical protein
MLGLNPRAVATLVLAVRRSNDLAIEYRSHPCSARFHPQLCLIVFTFGQDLIHSQLDLIHIRLDLIHIQLDLLHTRIDLIHIPHSTRLDLICTRLDVIHTWLDLIHIQLDLINAQLDITHTLLDLIHHPSG